MKTTRSSSRSGSALLLALIAFLFMAGIGGAIFSLTLAGRRTTVAASFGDGAYHVAESGIDDAINQMRAYMKLPDVTDADYYDAFAKPATDADGNFVNVITGSIRGGTYTATISPALQLKTAATYTISSVGRLNGERRGIRTTVASVEVPSINKFGLFGHKYLHVAGSAVSDGYSSLDANGNPQSYKAVATSKTVDGKEYTLGNQTGHVGSNGLVDVQNQAALIYGDGKSGEGISTSDKFDRIEGDKTSLIQEMELGTIDFQEAKSGIDYTFPKAKPNDPPPTLSTGIYKVTSLTENLVIKGNVILYVTGDIDYQSTKSITLADSTSTLKVYQDSESGQAAFNINGSAMINPSGRPGAMEFYTNTHPTKKTGEPILQKINGNAEMAVTVFAPLAALDVTGNSAIYGSIIANSIDFSGSGGFHYDETLGDKPTGIFVINVKSVDQFIPSSQY